METVSDPDAVLALLVLKELSDASIEHCVLRNFEQLPCKVGNDLDVLVSAGCLYRAMMITKEVATEAGWRLTGDDCGYSMRALIFVNAQGELRVDFFTRLTKGWLRYGHASDVLSGRNEARGFYSADMSDVFYTVVVKECLTYGKVREKYRALLAGVPIAEADFVRRGAGLFSRSSLREVYGAVASRGTGGRCPRLRPTMRNLLRPLAALGWIFSRISCSRVQAASRQS